MDIVEQLKRDEGLRLFPYVDTVGKLTIGYGRNLEGSGISSPEAEFMLQNDIQHVREQLEQSLPWSSTLDDARLGVLMNMAFNMGVGGLMGFRQMLASLQTGDYAGAAAAMQDSKWFTQVGDRAARLVQQMKTGVWV